MIMIKNDNFGWYF